LALLKWAKLKQLSLLTGSASKRADGIAEKATKGKMMAGGGMAKMMAGGGKAKMMASGGMPMVMKGGQESSSFRC
jgi:hypothetical protein